MKPILILAIFLLCCVMLVGCAPGANELTGTPREKGSAAGFWLGLWQGIISPVTFVVSLFTRSVQMYEVHNNGGWYNFGFLLGLSIIFGGGAGGASRRSRRRS
jgi:predicted phage tail protein